jgi:glycosyltransferase involved in cell wall biosynthesis
LEQISDWASRVHVIPGYSRPLYLRLVAQLSHAAVPWAHWSESSRPSWRSTLTWPLKRYFARQINQHGLGAFAQGEFAARDFIRWGIRRDKIAHLYYAVRGCPATIIPDQQTVDFVGGRTAFVFVGSLCHRKACDVLITAFERLSSTFLDTALVIVGDGPRRDECRARVRALGLDNRVLFRGVLPITAIGSVLRCCHAMVLPSRFDGWGVVLNEGASAGLALIASDRVGAAYHLIEPGLNGFVVRPGCAESLAAGLRAYASDSSLATAHGKQSLTRFQHFTPEANAIRLVTSVRGWLASDSRWARWHASWRDGSRQCSSAAA